MSTSWIDEQRKIDIHPNFTITNDTGQKLLANMKLPLGQKGTTANKQILLLKRNRELLWSSLGFGPNSIISRNTNQTIPYIDTNRKIKLDFLNKTDFHQNYALLLTLLLEIREVGAILGNHNSRMIDHPSQLQHRSQLIEFFEDRRRILAQIEKIFQNTNIQFNPTTNLLKAKPFQLNLRRLQFFTHSNSAIQKIKKEILNPAKPFSLHPSSSTSELQHTTKLEQSFIKKSNSNKQKIIQSLSGNEKIPKNLIILSIQSRSSFLEDQWNSFLWISLLNELLSIEFPVAHIGFIAAKSSFGEFQITTTEPSLHGLFNQTFSHGIFIFKHSTQSFNELKNLTDFTADLKAYINNLSSHNKKFAKTLYSFTSSNSEVTAIPLTFLNSSHIKKINLNSRSDQQFITDLATLLTIERRIIYANETGKQKDSKSSRWSFRCNIPS